MTNAKLLENNVEELKKTLRSVDLYQEPQDYLEHVQRELEHDLDENEFIDLLEVSLIQTQEHLGLRVGDDALLQAARSLPARQEAVTEAEQVLQDLINRFPTLATKERLIAVLKGNLKH